ncbi:Putative 3-methyladenine DNA glycosylase [Herminiimonas arsenicoxydans]|uniref:Putative 3-methyladenine DNA glycosylase n=1 Tax=Herminiimonas arsenicoxydans TaxID=204773 RepID=A4G953_HERAR|nr:Putative 3-methyladenine DNA glycosylase [Herminiimonas arsenicoxydans]
MQRYYACAAVMLYCLSWAQRLGDACQDRCLLFESGLPQAWLALHQFGFALIIDAMNAVFAALDFTSPSSELARRLIGVTVLIDGVGGRIVETEAYDFTDPASHCFGGQTPRNASMFGPPAHAYVYRSYGVHWCMNFVCCEEGHGAGVLIRALEPTTGMDIMRQRRGVDDVRLLCSGPGRLCQALGVTHQLNGVPLDAPPFQLLLAAEPVSVVSGPRIGISKAVDVPWRFGLAGSRFVSRPFSRKGE